MATNDEVLENLKQALEARGYEVTINDGNTRVKGETLTYRHNVDLALTVAHVIGYGAQITIVSNGRQPCLMKYHGMFTKYQQSLFPSTIQPICMMLLWLKRLLTLIIIMLILLNPS